MRSPLFTGVSTALVTPFLNGHINFPMLEVLISRQIQAKIPAIVLAGTTGESATLSDEEKLLLIQKGKEYAEDRIKIIAGTGSNSTEHAIRLSVAAEKAGADALLVVSPYYNKATPEGLVHHYATIAAAVHIPVILYNVPSRTGQDIPVAVYQKLSSIENIVGVKEASSDMEKIIEIRRKCKKDFCIWSGNDALTVPVISLGGQGVISVVSNVIPQAMRAITDAAMDGDFDTAASLQWDLHPLEKLLFSEVNPIPVKEAMRLIGYDCGTCRSPLTPLSEPMKRKLEICLR